MPNAKILSEKQAIVADLTEKFQNAAAGVIVDYRGITVAEDTELRAQMRANGVEYFVVKNTLARFGRVLQEAGRPGEVHHQVRFRGRQGHLSRRGAGPGRAAQQRGPGRHRSGHPYCPHPWPGYRSGRQHLRPGPRDAGHRRPEGRVSSPLLPVRQRTTDPSNILIYYIIGGTLLWQARRSLL